VYFPYHPVAHWNLRLTASVSQAPLRWLLGINVLIVALNLRPALSGVGPLLKEAIHTAHLGLGEISVLTSGPVLLLGVCAPLATVLTRRLGAERTVLAVLLVIAAGLAVRLGGTSQALLGGCLLAAAGIGVGNVILPALIKREFADRSALMIGLYTMALCLGGALAPGVAVPLARWVGDGSLDAGWPTAMAAWAIPALIACGLWLPYALKNGPHATGPAATPAVVKIPLLGNPLAWQATAYMGLQSSLVYIGFSWLAPILRDRGLSPEAAGLAAFIYFIGQVPSALAAPLLAGRRPDQRVAVAVSMALCLAGFMGCLFIPVELAGGAGLWLATLLVGLGQGATFGLALLIIVVRSANGRVAAQLSAMAQGFGYTLAAGGPLVISLLHALTTGWLAVAAALVCLMGATLTAGLLAARNKIIDG